ncbi:U3 small nucleolar RNA-associated protein 8 [Scheffersomyces xylosifermentans]|uniref:U3 small nucleolar RNA-associated protein 8 n=1 Tax=Scheffersomyces xylosifermentans TaxID=1304137 RepID=UPI00315CD94E
MSTESPSLTGSYPLSTLPRIPDLKLSEKVIIPTITSHEPNTIDVGISKSIISSYIIKPTPKLIWSYALSPSSIVDCMSVLELSTKKLYIVGVTERKKSKLLLIVRTIGGETEESITETVELKLEERVKGVEFYQEGKLIVVIYESGSVELIKNEDNKELLQSGIQLGTTSGKRTRGSPKLVFHQFINDIVLNNNVGEENKDFIVLIFHEDSHLVYKMISLNIQNSNIFEINSTKFACSDSNSVKIAYASGYLYQLNLASQEITSLPVLSFKPEHTISVQALLDGKSNIDEISFLAPSIDRLLLSVGNKIHLINFKFSCLLDTFESRSSSSSATNPDNVLVSQVVRVKGTGKATKSLAVYLYLKKKDNNVYLNVINIDVGLNTLNECLGKSINKSNEDKLLGLVDLANPNFESEVKNLAKQLKEVYNSLEEAKNLKDVNKWERVLIPYLKNESWDSIKKSLKGKKKTNDKVHKFKEFEVENDRAVDVNFISKVLHLIFELNDSKQVVFVDPEFVPEHTLIYLLTNPIFPVEFTRGLLKLFNESNLVTLLRQAIITCPNLTIHELLLQLVSAENDEDIFQDLINRLIGEFSIVDINRQFKELLQNEKSYFNLNDLLNRLLQVKSNNKSWYLIEIIIDVGGLFNWPSDTVDKLNELIESKVNALIGNSYNLTLTNQVLLLNEPIAKKKKKSKKTVSKSNAGDIISNNAQQQSQLDSILTVNSASKNKHLDDSSIEISKKFPTYSVDRLVL